MKKWFSSVLLILIIMLLVACQPSNVLQVPDQYRIASVETTLKLGDSVNVVVYNDANEERTFRLSTGELPDGIMVMMDPAFVIIPKHQSGKAKVTVFPPSIIDFVPNTEFGITITTDGMKLNKSDCSLTFLVSG